jgi:hypothetical protein
MNDTEHTADALQYVTEVLSNGCSLSREIEDDVKQRRGAFRFVPELPGGVSTVRQLWEGGVWSRFSRDERESETRAFIQEIGIWLQRTRCIAVLELPLASPSDPWLKNSGLPVCSYNEEVYLPIQSGDSQTVDSWLGSTAVWPPLVCFFCEMPPDDEAICDLLKKGEFTKIIGRVSKLLIGAFDGEGYLWWDRAMQ